MPNNDNVNFAQKKDCMDKDNNSLNILYNTFEYKFFGFFACLSLAAVYSSFFFFKGQSRVSVFLPHSLPSCRLKMHWKLNAQCDWNRGKQDLNKLHLTIERKIKELKKAK